jgi:F-type H+-transporting ATPase subunit epsilon
MAKKFKVEIVTPERVVLSEEIESLVVPAERGYLGVLAGHAPLLCALRPGEIKMVKDGAESWYSTSGGFMEIAGGKASLLTDSAEPAAEIDIPRAQEAVDRAKERLAASAKGVDKERATLALERASNRLRVASKRKR